MNDIRVVVADDHPLYRFGLRAALEAEDGIEVVAEAESGTELLDLAERHRPDVVVTDVSMPGLDGVAATRALRTRLPGVAVLVVTMHEDDATVRAAMRAGASGYLVKGADRAELARAVRTVAGGGSTYGRAVADRIAGFFTASTDDYAQQVFPNLTPRERDVLDHVARGLGNVAVAARLQLSEKTVRNVLASVLVKLQAPDRAAAIALAREAGLGAIER
ncbi:MAG TPA: response regulator transcription factor [Frankiaceae bacterium]|nr:response regulator transcription factor [Frankiaceae bacterium]